jgi:hypothetical protein
MVDLPEPGNPTNAIRTTTTHNIINAQRHGL